MAEMMADACTTLRYRTPAVTWTDALPLGNGRLGAMCFGGIEEDRFQLNENTCWSGTPGVVRGEGTEPSVLGCAVGDGPALLGAARAAFARGDVRAAEESLRRMQGGNSQAYQPLADLWIGQGDVLGGDAGRPAGVPGPAPTVYQRHLDMRSAVASHTYGGAAGRVSQEAWIGRRALVIRRRMQNPGPLRLRLTSPHATAVHESPYLLTVRMPSDVASQTYGPGSVTAMVGLRVVGATAAGAVGAVQAETVLPGAVLAGAGQARAALAGVGQAAQEGERLVVEGGDLVFIVAAVTDYVDPLTAPHGDLGELRRTLWGRLDDVEAALGREGGYTALRAAHEREHLRLFSRAAVRLGPPEAPARLDTAERLSAHAAGESDPALAALQFQYGRYLLIAASRPGGLPAGLQGLWNEHLRPPWNANYTTNINLEMNYWPALVANLSECHVPLLDWLKYVAVRGARVARELYGLGGWTLHHNSDAWGFAMPAGEGHDEVKWSFWPLAGAWLARHAAEHHAFTGNDSWLPLVRGAAEFCLDWLVEMPDGTLGTSPSTSPENEFVAADGRPAAASVSTTSDLALIRDLLTSVAAEKASVGTGKTSMAAGKTGVGTELANAAASKALSRLPSERVGADGRLAEWSTDLTDAEPEHRHTSHLFGVFPGCSVDPDTTPELAAAARRSLDARGLESTGWSLAWRIALRARLRDGAGAFAAVQRFLTPAGARAGAGQANAERAGEERAGEERAGVYLNLFCAHPPFQIDGNFGFTAGVAEMLLQSHAGEIHLLPALPPEWGEGAFEGLRARGGVTVDATWSRGVPHDVRLCSDLDRTVTVRFGDQRLIAELRAGEAWRCEFKAGAEGV